MKRLVIIFVLMIAARAVVLPAPEVERVQSMERVIPWDERGHVEYRKPPRDKIDELRKNPLYSYDSAEPEQVNGLLARLLEQLSEWFRNGIAHLSWMKYVLGVVAVLFIVFVVLRLLNIGGTGIALFSKRSSASPLTLLHPAEIGTVDELMRQFKQYRSNGAYRDAVRMLYLIYLRCLNDAGAIKLADSKTNRDYACELNDDRLRKTFRSLARLYDYVWFGQFELADSQYRLIENEFGSQLKTGTVNAERLLLQ